MMLMMCWATRRLLLSLRRVGHNVPSLCMCIVHGERSVWVWCCETAAEASTFPDEQHVCSTARASCF